MSCFYTAPPALAAPVRTTRSSTRLAIPKQPWTPSAAGAKTRSRSKVGRAGKIVKPSAPLYDASEVIARKRRRSIAQKQVSPPEPVQCSPPVITTPSHPAVKSLLSCPCGKTGSVNQDWILCEAGCEQWFHKECLNLSKEAWSSLSSNVDKSYTCPACIIIQTASSLWDNTSRSIRTHFEKVVSKSLNSRPVKASNSVKSTPIKISVEPSLESPSTPPTPPTVVRRPSGSSQVATSVPDQSNSVPIVSRLSPEQIAAALPGPKSPTEQISVTNSSTDLGHGSIPTPTKADIEAYKDIDPDLVVLIDGISNPYLFRNSSRIKAEVCKHYPGLRIRDAYPLPAGGVCLVFHNKEDADLAKLPWPKSAFGSDKIFPHPPKKALSHPSKLVVPGVPQNISIHTILDNNTGIDLARRLIFNGHITNTLVLTPVSEEAAHFILKNGLKAEDITYKAHPKRNTKIVRCFRCQQFGHISSRCTRSHSTCGSCAGDHNSSQCKTKSHSCSNCGKNHPAWSPHCLHYKAIAANLLKRSLTLPSQSTRSSPSSQSLKFRSLTSSPITKVSPVSTVL